MVDFNPIDSSTWPLMLTDVQIAAIFQRAVGGIRNACKRGRFVPAPVDGKPRRWRRVDVVRFVEGERGGYMRRVG